MALDVFVVGTVVVTGAALLGYRLLGKKGKEAPVSGGPLGTPAAPMLVNIKSVMMLLVSKIALGSCLYVILSGQYDEGSQKWAFGIVGSIMGFWLRLEAS